jgi:hypothetical protein
MGLNEINKWWSENYSALELYATKWIRKSKKAIQPGAMLSDTYLYLYERKDSITDKSILESWAKNHIKLSVGYSNSKINRTERITAIPDTIDRGSDNWIDLESTTKKLIAGFAATLPPIEKRLFLLYWESNLTTAYLLSKHLDIAISTGYNCLRKIKTYDEAFKKYCIDHII